MFWEAWPQRLAVIGPAGPADPDKVKAGVRLLEKAGRSVRFYPDDLPERDAKARERHEYLAAPDATRAEALMQAYLDPAVDAVLAQRGGFGCAKILPLLDHAKLAAAPVKPVIGYSDLTALHAAMTAFHWGRPVIAPMAASLVRAAEEEGEYTYASARKVFRQEDHEIVPPAGELKTLNPGDVSAPFFAGNLTVLASLCGSSYFPDLTGKILLLEDVGEAPYRLDRNLTQLGLNGVFCGIAGVFFGQFSDCGTPRETDRLLAAWAERLPCPVVANLPFGHTFPLAAWDLAAELRWEQGILSQHFLR